MDKNEFEGSWKEIRSQTKLWWGLITDADLNKVEKADIKYFEFVTLLQLKYQLDRQVAKDEIGRRVTQYESSLKIDPVISSQS
jgi:hypothetical protein